jgi:hypothetical protein
MGKVIRKSWCAWTVAGALAAAPLVLGQEPASLPKLSTAPQVSNRPLAGSMSDRARLKPVAGYICYEVDDVPAPPPVPHLRPQYGRPLATAQQVTPAASLGSGTGSVYRAGAERVEEPRKDTSPYCPILPSSGQLAPAGDVTNLNVPAAASVPSSGGATYAGGLAGPRPEFRQVQKESAQTPDFTAGPVVPETYTAPAPTRPVVQSMQRIQLDSLRPSPVIDASEPPSYRADIIPVFTSPPRAIQQVPAIQTRRAEEAPASPTRAIYPVSTSPAPAIEDHVRRICGRAFADVAVSSTSSKSLMIHLKVQPCPDAEVNRIGLAIMKMPELAPFKADLDVSVVH